MSAYLRGSTTIALALFLLLHACAPAEMQQTSPEPATLKVNVLPFLSFAPFFIAQEEGFFTEQALQVEFTQLQEPTEDIPALISGELDVAAGRIWPNQLNAIARGSSIRLVADKGYVSPQGCTYSAIMVRPALVESGALQTPAQLRGRKIAVISLASFTGYFLDTVLNRAGLTIEDIEMLKIPVPVRPDALEKGSADATTVSEPWITRMIEGGQAVIWMPIQEVLTDSQHAFVYYGPNLLNEKPDVGKRFMVAYLKAVRQYNLGKTERNLEILAKYTELDQELLRQACWTPIHDDGQINLQSVLDFQTWAVDKAFLDRSVAEEQFWDPSFIEHANQVLGGEP